MLAADPAAVEIRLRALCLALPETGERISHGIPAFDVAGKMFAYFRHDHHSDGTTVVCVKTSGRDEQEFLIEADPDTYSRPAYLWPSGWIAVTLAERVDWALVESRLLASWRLAAGGAPAAHEGLSPALGLQGGALNRRPRAILGHRP